MQFGVDPLAASNSKLPVPAPVMVGDSMPWRTSRLRVRPALSTAWAIAWRRSLEQATRPVRSYPVRHLKPVFVDPALRSASRCLAPARNIAKTPAPSV